MNARAISSQRSRIPGLALLGSGAVLLTGLAGCAGHGQVELANRKPAEQLARETREAQPSASVYSGWRVFQDKCARCHGSDARGSAQAPDLLPRVGDMGQRRFVGLVLSRYDWGLPPDQARGSEAQIEGVIQRQQGALSMPAWQGEPSVQAHITDLYAYLSARSSGAQGPGQPSR
ncbi:c-type cytochrome [Kinneretia asaccharophila]|uniref:Cbb3-type cytochrome c oxidase subunit III n=1 Tax=Roseateles asaccharophilus TaxID=582607 RepID=A0A4R6NCK8_9BURK|nr:c-type cytochrome [Roseateles asaccharophilus]MDN3542932.1 c-type cytochrome [Roseateles asaccharophilus]TDP13368.1 cbb3-type cytochrome c oxidase subunit III [Roseateles asaccharophilus]